MSEFIVSPGESIGDAVKAAKSGDTIFILGADGTDTYTKEGVVIKRASHQTYHNTWLDDLESKQGLTGCKSSCNVVHGSARKT